VLTFRLIEALARCFCWLRTLAVCTASTRAGAHLEQLEFAAAN